MPWMCDAAIPLMAQTPTRLCSHRSSTERITWLFPVPARPVMSTFLPSMTSFRASAARPTAGTVGGASWAGAETSPPP